VPTFPVAPSTTADAVGDVVKAPARKAEDVKSSLGDKIGGAVSNKVEEKVNQAGGPGGILKSALKKSLPFGGSGDDQAEGGDDGLHGIGEGRRMPVQQNIDVALPIDTVYNQWTQFEEWPNFMHRVKRVTQEDRCNVSFAVKIWGQTREFNAQISTQRPDDCVKWTVNQGINHTGAVFFRELAPGSRGSSCRSTSSPAACSRSSPGGRGTSNARRAATCTASRHTSRCKKRRPAPGAGRSRTAR